MSASHEEKPWFERWWQPLLIAFGIVFILTMAFYNPIS